MGTWSFIVSTFLKDIVGAVFPVLLDRWQKLRDVEHMGGNKERNEDINSNIDDLRKRTRNGL